MRETPEAKHLTHKQHVNDKKEQQPTRASRVNTNTSSDQGKLRNTAGGSKKPTLRTVRIHNADSTKGELQLQAGNDDDQERFHNTKLPPRRGRIHISNRQRGHDERPGARIPTQRTKKYNTNTLVHTHTRRHHTQNTPGSTPTGC